jgi:hypothetical protein
MDVQEAAHNTCSLILLSVGISLFVRASNKQINKIIIIMAFFTLGNTIKNEVKAGQFPWLC